MTVRFFVNEIGVIGASADDDVVILPDGAVCRLGKSWRVVSDVTEADLTTEAAVTLSSRIRHRQMKEDDMMKTRRLIGSVQAITKVK